MTVLLTGFEPFGGEARNPSAEIVARLKGTRIAGELVAGVVLPCTYGTAGDVLRAQIAALRPRLVIALGQFGGRRSVTPERVAINLDDAPVPDNAGELRTERPIRVGGTPAYFSRLPVADIAAAINAAGIPSGISLSAGTFVCNHLFYELMEALAGTPTLSAGFIHVPFLPEQAPEGVPSMPLDAMCQAVSIAIATSLRGR